MTTLQTYLNIEDFWKILKGKVVAKQKNHQLKLKILKYFHEPNVRRMQVLMNGVKGKTDKIRRNNVIDN